MPTVHDPEALERAVRETGKLYVAKLPLKHGDITYEPSDPVPVDSTWGTVPELVANGYLSCVEVPANVLNHEGGDNQVQSLIEPTDEQIAELQAAIDQAKAEGYEEGWNAYEAATGAEGDGKGTDVAGTDDGASPEAVNEGGEQEDTAPETVKFDPHDHGVEEVLAYVAEHPDELDAIVAQEQAGKARKTLLQALATESEQ